MFPTLNKYLISINVSHKELLKTVIPHLKLANNFEHYLLEHEDPRLGNLQIKDSFIEDFSKCNLDPNEKVILIE